MAFPDVSDALDEFVQSVTKRVVTRITDEDFNESSTFVDSTIKAVVQVAKKEELKIEQIDWSLQYIQVHSTTELDIDNHIVWKSKSFKLIAREDYSDYGYYEATGEEIK